MRLTRLWMFGGALAFAGVATFAGAQAPNRIIVPYAPGGSMNTMARLFADKLADAVGRPFVVENRAGAAGVIGSALIKGAPADGSVLLYAADSNISIYPATVVKPAYDPLTDFVAVAHTGGYRIALVVNPSVPAADLRSFIAWTRSQPGPVSYGGGGAGTNLHFYGMLFTELSGARMAYVPYKGTGPVAVDLIGGHILVGMMPMGVVLPHAKAGKMRVLAQTGEGRAASMPDVASFKELGHPTLTYTGWYGVFAPIAMPAELVHRYNDVIVKASRTPEIRDRLRAYELEPSEMDPRQFQSLVKAETERWRPIVKASGFTAGSE